MKPFALSLCLLYFGTSAASHLRDEIIRGDAETLVVDLDVNPNSNFYDTAQVYKACLELQYPPQQPGSPPPVIPYDSLVDFCDMIGPDLGSLCFADSDCGDYTCSTATEGPKEAVVVYREVQSTEGLDLDRIFFERQGTTHENVFICYDETDRSDAALNEGRKPLCQQGCDVCLTAAFECFNHQDCVLGGRCIENEHLGIYFCHTTDELVAEGGCCTDGAQCAGGYCVMDPGSFIQPGVAPGASTYGMSTGICGKRD